MSIFLQITNFVFFGMAYLMGSISSALLLSRFFSLPNPQENGSGNPGATNMLRLSGWKWGVITLLCDALKAFIPIFLLKLLGVNYMYLSWILFSVVLGHIYPIFFGFKGGKGVATTLGGVFALSPLLGLLFVSVWLAVVMLTNYVSLASIISAIWLPLAAIILGYSQSFVALLLLALLLLWRHRSNISRLRYGNEPKVELTKFKQDK